MAKILVMSTDELELLGFEAGIKTKHDVVTANDVRSALKMVKSEKPDGVVAKMNARGPGAIQILQFIKDYRLNVPVLVVVDPKAASLKPTAVKLLAKDFVSAPVRREELLAAVDKIVASSDGEEKPPPLTSIEERGNLTDLAKRMNQAVKCAIGQNQVYVRSPMFRGGILKQEKTRIALKCKVRPMYGMSQEVYFEHIQKVCCGDCEGLCEALKKYREHGAR